MMEGAGAGRVAAVVGDVLDDLDDNADRPPHDEPVLAPEGHDRRLRDSLPGVRAVEVAVGGERSDASDQIGRKACRAQMISAGSLHGPAVGEGRAPELAEELLALDARRQGDDDVASIDVLAGRAPQAAGVEQAEQQVEQIGVRLLHLVDEEDAARARRARRVAASSRRARCSRAASRAGG